MRSCVWHIPFPLFLCFSHYYNYMFISRAPVRCWTTARKLDGSAWTKVVLLEEEEWSWAKGGEARLEAMGD
ncbi:unnamed protein product, partial [Vitis vinifera]